MKAYYLFSLIPLLLSCSKKEGPFSNNGLPIYSIEIIDSLVIDDVGQYFLSDISDTNRQFLFYNMSSKEFVIVGKDGEIINKFNKTGDIPNSIGNHPNGLPRFYNEDNIIVLGQKGIMVYDLEGNFKKALHPDFKIVNRFFSPTRNNLTKIDSDLYLATLEGRHSSLGYGLEYQKESTKLELINLTGENRFEPKIKFSNQSRFSSEEALYDPLFTQPFFANNREFLFLAYGNEPLLHQYELSTFELVSSTPIFDEDEISKFILNEGEPKSSSPKRVSEFKPRNLFFGEISNIQQADQFTFVSYKYGLSDREFDLISQNTDDVSQIMNEAGRKNPIHFKVFDSENNQVSNLNIPDNLGYILQVKSPEEIYMSAKQSYERDYEVLYRVRLRRE